MRAPAEVLSQARVQLRRCRHTDVDALHQLVNESLQHLRPWMGWCAGTYDQAAAADFLDHCESSWGSGTAYTYAITTDGQLGGYAESSGESGPAGSRSAIGSTPHIPVVVEQPRPYRCCWSRRSRYLMLIELRSGTTPQTPQARECRNGLASP